MRMSVCVKEYLILLEVVPTGGDTSNTSYDNRSNKPEVSHFHTFRYPLRLLLRTCACGHEQSSHGFEGILYRWDVTDFAPLTQRHRYWHCRIFRTSRNTYQ